MLKKRVVLIIVVMAFLAPASKAQNANSFTVQQAADYAMKNSVQVKNALLDIQLQKQTNKEITAAAYPQLNGSLTVNDYLSIPTSLIPAEFFGGAAGTFIPVKFGTKYNAGFGFDINQLLFDGQVFVGLMARKSSIEFAQKNVEVTQEMIKANVYKIYYQLVVGRQQITSIDANISRFEKLLHDTKEIYKNGFAEKLDVDKVEVQLTNLRTEKLRAENQIESGYSGLKFLMNMPQGDNLTLSDTLSENELKQNILDSAYDFKNRKDYQWLSITAKLQGYNIKRYKLSKIPTVSSFLNYNQNAQREKFDFFAAGDWYLTSIVGLKISVPLFDGGARNARISKARLDLQKTQNNISQLKSSIDKDVTLARLNMKTALATMDAQKKNTDLAEEVYRVTKLKYEQGLGNNQEIYNAQTELKVAQNNYYGALYDAINAKIDYLRATGRL
jgi:outer membrane protein